jgi:hypothetical protein
VTVFEALHVVGGVLRYGIPSFRLPREIIDRELQQLRDAGVRFETNKVIGKTFGVQQLMQDNGLRRRLHRRRCRRAHVPGHPRRVGRAGVLGQRIPHARQPDGRRPLPLPRHAGGPGPRVA